MFASELEFGNLELAGCPFASCLVCVGGSQFEAPLAGKQSDEMDLAS